MNLKNLLLFIGLIISSLASAQTYDIVGEYTISNDVGIGISNPATRLHVRKESVGITSQYAVGAIEHTDAQLDLISSSNGTWGSALNFIEGNGSSNTDVWSIVRKTSPNSSLNFNYGTNNSSINSTLMTLNTDGKVGIGTGNPLEMLHVAGNIRLGSNYKLILKNGNSVYAEMLTATWGKGGGLMINAAYSGSGDPQSNATYTVDDTGYPTGAGYLDFDGNAKRWTINVAPPSTGLGTAATFVQEAVFDDSFISLSPRGTEEDFYMNLNGNVGIGTNSPGNKLEVNGTIRSQEVIVETENWPDYVFSDAYELRSLEATEQFISENHHLPDIPSAAEVEENGIQLSEMNALLLKKIEELTLHQIELLKEIKSLKEWKEAVQSQNSNLKSESSK